MPKLKKKSVSQRSSINRQSMRKRRSGDELADGDVGHSCPQRDFPQQASSAVELPCSSAQGTLHQMGVHAHPFKPSGGPSDLGTTNQMGVHAHPLQPVLPSELRGTENQMGVHAHPLPSGPSAHEKNACGLQYDMLVIPKLLSNKKNKKLFIIFIKTTKLI